MKELIQAFAQIALLRRGPQDLPASRLLLAVTMIAYLGVCLLVINLMPPQQGWEEHPGVEILFWLVWYFILLRLSGRSERILQTTTAVIGFQTILAAPILISDWLFLRFLKDETWQLPVALMWLMLFIWMVAANSHVVKAAFEWSSFASVALVILQLYAGQLLVTALFPSLTPGSAG
jgi:hypothetical protein